MVVCTLLLVVVALGVFVLLFIIAFDGETLIEGKTATQHRRDTPKLTTFRSRPRASTRIEAYVAMTSMSN